MIARIRAEDLVRQVSRVTASRKTQAYDDDLVRDDPLAHKRGALDEAIHRWNLIMRQERITVIGTVTLGNLKETPVWSVLKGK